MDKPIRNWCRPPLGRIILLLAWSGLIVDCQADSTLVFQCTLGDGRVEFRQTLCADGDQQELEIKDVKVGWEAPTATVKLTKKSAKKARKSSGSSSRRKEKQAKDCFKTEQKLENVNRRLRRGYKAGQGSDLRHKRRQYEAYLGRFCQ